MERTQQLCIQIQNYPLKCVFSASFNIKGYEIAIQTFCSARDSGTGRKEFAPWKRKIKRGISDVPFEGIQM